MRGASRPDDGQVLDLMLENIVRLLLPLHQVTEAFLIFFELLQNPLWYAVFDVPYILVEIVVSNNGTTIGTIEQDCSCNHSASTKNANCRRSQVGIV